VALLGPAARDAAVRLARAWGQNAIVCADEHGAVLLVAARPGFCGLDAGDFLPL
jgi:hypothetical protein